MTRIRSLLTRPGRLPLSAGALILASALAACSSAPPLFLSDGRPTQQVQCPSAGDHDSCNQQARVQCGAGGYDTIDESDAGGTHTLVFACRAK